MIGEADAAFDALAIVTGLGTGDDGVLEGEVHMIAYLASLLHIYAGYAPQDWGYGFATTPAAAPFADAIDLALANLRRVGLARNRGPALHPTPQGEPELLRWSTLPRNAQREPYVRAAAQAAGQVTLPTMARGLNQEPQLRHAAQVGGMRALPDEFALDELREHFETIDGVMGGSLGSAAPALDDELMVRAALWLDYLSASSREAA